MKNFAEADFYADKELHRDPHAYFDYLRAEVGPVATMPARGVIAITGYEEAIEVMLDNVHFSAINSVTGPVPPLPLQLGSDDIADQVEAIRPTLVFADQIVTQDGARHADLRSIMAKLFTPSRLKALQPKLVETSSMLLDEFIDDGKVELVSQYGRPYATLVITDLLGIPDKDRAWFRDVFRDSIPIEIGADAEAAKKNPIITVAKKIFGYITKRRLLLDNPIARMFRKEKTGGDRDEILTELALARFPDGSKPTITDVTALSAFLFGAGQDTTNRLLAACLRQLAEHPELQDRLRDNPKDIPTFIEEVLRFEGPVKGAGRLCVKSTTVGGVEIKAGTVLLVSHLAANRDPRRFPEPAAFDMDRPKLKEHLAFGRGAHTCIGSPLAREEVRVSLTQILSRMKNIRFDETRHGPKEARQITYEPTYVLCAIKELYLEFDKIG
ncbi:MAG: cytochrome P450 [Sphingomonadaceae bacterium]